MPLVLRLLCCAAAAALLAPVASGASPRTVRPLAFDPEVIAIPATPGQQAGIGPSGARMSDIAQAEPWLLATGGGRMYLSAMYQQRACTTGGAQAERPSDCVWRSDDDGKHWRLVGGGTRTQADVQLVRSRAGTLVQVADAQLGAGSGTGGITVLRSRDEKTWEQQFAVGGLAFADRPFLLSLPSGTLLVVMTSVPGHVYASRSTDDGRTWSPATPMTTAPLQLGFAFPGGPAYDAVRRQVVVPVPGTAPGDIYAAAYGTSLSGNELLSVARSSDEGRTWRLEPVTLRAPVIGLPNVAVDAAGTEYLAYATGRDGGSDAAVVVQRPGGRWSAPVRLDAPDHTAVRTWVVAGRAGHAAVLWMDAARPSRTTQQTWTLQLALTRDGGATWGRQQLSQGAVFAGSAGDPLLLDAMHLVLTPEGRLCAAYPKQVDPVRARTATTIVVRCQSRGGTAL